MHKKVVVAHAGGRSHATANTLEAFGHAISVGVDLIEFDVRRTADGELVVHHDDAIGGRRLTTMAYAACARRAESAGYTLPRLREVLELAAGRVKLDVELKEVGSETAVLCLLADHGFHPTDVVVTSFEMAAIVGVKAESADIRTGLLVCDVTGAEALELFRKSGADFLAPDYLMLDADTLRDARASHVELLPWTVNDPPAIRDLLADAAVIGVIADDIVAALDVRDRLDPSTDAATASVARRHGQRSGART